MKYVDEFRDGKLAQALGRAIAADVRPGVAYRFMEFCGGHTHAISRYGLEDLLPASIRMIHGPGCPVCVLPAGRIDMAIALAQKHDVTLCVYGDLMRVPGSGGQSLMRAKARGCDVRMIYSTLDAIRIAEETPARQVVFFAIGFETTTPPTAMAIREAQRRGLTNFTIFCNHVLTPPAIQNILESPAIRDIGRVEIDGFIGPAHVSTVIGTEPYEFFAEEFGKPVVVAGFEPLDVMQAIAMLVRQVNEGRNEVENQYSRAVTREGNRRAKNEVADIFELRDRFEWRGLGIVPYSALRLKEAYRAYDAERRFALAEITAPDNPACECGAILRGVRKPVECKLFGTACTPETPMGSCMVSSEGACAAHWTYGRFRDAAERRVS
jgi:hydrogenase expression/formation protein HypD